MKRRAAVREATVISWRCRDARKYGRWRAVAVAAGVDQ